MSEHQTELQIGDSDFFLLKDPDIGRNLDNYHIQLVIDYIRDLVRERSQSNSSELIIEDNSEPDHRDDSAEENADAGSDPFAKFFFSILSRFDESVKGPITAVFEYFHNDPSYRNLYYEHYSKKYFETSRFSIRISFFAKKLDETTFFNCKEEDLSKCHIGSCVINPLETGLIGRTLINPKYILDESAYLRLSDFETTVKGKRIVTRAFPYRAQDGEVLCCAEITILNLLCYYANEYHDYRVMLPSDILDLKEQFTDERATPSRGLPYYDVSKIIANAGFHPRLYNINELGPGVEGDSDVRFKRLLHWYISSGIPVAVNVCSNKPHIESHSLLCIGYKEHDSQLMREVGCCFDPPKRTNTNKEAIAFAQSVLDKSYLLTLCDETTGVEQKSCMLIHSADLIDEYVVMDDGQCPYAIRPYKQLSLFDEFKCTNYVVPLHHGMVMDAMDAYENGVAILSHRKLGVLNWAGDYIKDGERIIFKMFMASVRSYKRHRVKNSSDEIASIYEDGVFPHFIWVFELYRSSDFFVDSDKRYAFAELVLDATSSGDDNPVSRIILIRYPNIGIYRDPNGNDVPLNITGDNAQIKPFSTNLQDPMQD